MCGVAMRGVSKRAVGVAAVELDAALRVPGVVAGGPGQGGAEGLDEVVEAPGQHHDVVGVTKEHNHHRGIAQAWGDINKQSTTRNTEMCFAGIGRSTVKPVVV